jgi:hypothetical protein
MLDQLKKYKTQVIIAAIVVVILIVVYLLWNKSSASPVKVVDDQGKPVSFTDDQRATASALADRIHEDINSGWLFGENFWGNLGRDSEAYDELIKLSDTMFALTCETYRKKYSSSLISDLRAETSLGTETRDLILSRADRLKIA